MPTAPDEVLCQVWEWKVTDDHFKIIALTTLALYDTRTLLSQKKWEQILAQVQAGEVARAFPPGSRIALAGIRELRCATQPQMFDMRTIEIHHDGPETEAGFASQEPTIRALRAAGRTMDEIFEALRTQVAPGVQPSPGTLSPHIAGSMVGLGLSLVLGVVLTTWACFAGGVPPQPGRWGAPFNLLNQGLQSIGPGWVAALSVALSLCVAWTILHRRSHPPLAQVVVVPRR